MADKNTPNLPVKKKIEPVVTDGVKVKKKSVFAKMRDMFIAEDASKVGSYILMDVLVPNIKRSIVDIIKSSADMIFGTTGSSKSNTGATRYSYGGIPYVNYSNANKKPEVPVSRSQYEIGDVLFENRADAEKVLTSLDELISAYGSASVADLCELVNKPYEFVANKYGWKNLHDAVPIMTPEGYVLRLPKSIPLE
jgi:hypothetical protein